MATRKRGRAVRRDGAGDSVLRIAGILGLVGGVAMIVGTVAAILVVDQHDWMRSTISQLAAGPHEWIQDLALYLFALGVAAVGVGIARLEVEGWSAPLAAALLIVIAADIVLMAAWENYSKSEHGLVIHPYAVYLLGIAFALVCLLLAWPLGQIGRRWRWASLAVLVAWAVLAPVYFMMPGSIEGLYERGLGLIVIGWIMALSVLLIAEGRAA